MIYFISQENNKYVKIGFTTGIGKKRLAAMQTGNPHKLKLLCVIDGDVSKEKWLHSIFRDHHIRGEWFRYVDDIKLCVDTNGDAIRYRMDKAQVDDFIKDNDLWGDVVLMQSFK